MCPVCNPVCGKCPTSIFWVVRKCSCGEINFWPKHETCKKCGQALEKPPWVRCSYNKMMCRFPCQNVNRVNESGRRLVCRNVRAMEKNRRLKEDFYKLK